MSRGRGLTATEQSTVWPRRRLEQAISSLFFELWHSEGIRCLFVLRHLCICGDGEAQCVWSFHSSMAQNVSSIAKVASWGKDAIKGQSGRSESPSSATYWPKPPFLFIGKTEGYISSVLLHNRLPLNLEASNNTHSLCYSFCGSGVWVWLSWVFCRKISPEAAPLGLARAVVPSEGSPGQAAGRSASAWPLAGASP